MTDADDDLVKELAEHESAIAGNRALDLDEQRALAWALQGRAYCLAGLGRTEEALGQWAAVRERFGAAADGDLRAYAAAAAVATGWELHRAERWDAAVAAYDDALALTEGRDDPALLVQAAGAFYRKALALSASGFSSDAVRAVAEVMNRFGDDPPPEALPDVADAMLLFVVLACRLGQEEAALPAYDRVIALLEDEEDENVRATVLRARVGRAVLLGRQGRMDEGVEACDGVLAELGAAPEGPLAPIRALALGARGDVLQEAGRPDEAAASYATLLREFGDGEDPEVDAALERARAAGAA